MYRDLWKPFHKRLNDWVHAHTPWKTFYHTCGSILAFLDDFIEAGVDIINPVQCSAAGMEAQGLKDQYGDKLVFWGGGVDTQQTLPFGTPEQVRRRGGRAHPHLQPGRRLRLQHHPQHPGPHAHGERAGPVRGGRGGKLC